MIWFEADTMPTTGAFMVLLEKPSLGSRIHVLSYMGTVPTICGTFLSDRTDLKIVGWRHLPPESQPEAHCVHAMANNLRVLELAAQHDPVMARVVANVRVYVEMLEIWNTPNSEASK